MRGRSTTAPTRRSVQLPGGGLSRRALLQRAGAGAAALTLPAWVSACGGDEETGVPAGDGRAEHERRRTAGVDLWHDVPPPAARLRSLSLAPAGRGLTIR